MSERLPLHSVSIYIMPENKTPARRRQPATASPEENFRHLQPQAPELEAAVLGSIMVEHDAYSLVSEILKPESFYEHRNQLVYTAIQTLMMEDEPVDMLTVTEQLKKMGKLDNVGGPLYITKLCDTVTGSSDIEYYAGIIAQKYLARQLISFSSRVQTSAFDETKDISELLQETEADLFAITQSNQRKDYTQIDPVIKEAEKMLHDAAARADGLSGIPSGFHELDKMTNGWQNSDLIIIAARPAMGKTAFALSMAKNIVVDQQIPLAFFSLEMSNVQLINRMITNVCEITGDKIRSGQLKPYEWNLFDLKIKQLYGKPFYIDDTPSLSIYELRTKARRLVREHNVKMIIIDYLQLMNASGSRFGSRQEEVSNISRSLKGLAKELNIPIIALSQLNRGVEQREGNEGKEPKLSDLRESGAIEQDADIVCFIHRPEYYKIYRSPEGEDLHGKAMIIVAKHRNGAVGDVMLNFKKNFARFENLDDDLIPTYDGQSAEFSSRINDDPLSSDTPLPSSTPDNFGNNPEDRPF